MGGENFQFFLNAMSHRFTRSEVANEAMWFLAYPAMDMALDSVIPSMNSDD